jgi:type II secretory pathway pseudopilin PulG
MNLKLYRNLTLRKLKPSEQGFSLIETVIALITLGICLAYAMPLFLYARVSNSKSEIRTGALIVSQRVFDNIRSRPLRDATVGFTNEPIPTTDGTSRDTGDPLLSNPGLAWKGGGNGDGTNPVVQPANMTNPAVTITPQEKLLTYAMGRQYRAKVTFCENVTVTPTVCSNNYRQFKVEVFYNGTKVYDLEGNLTDFQQNT